MDLYTVRRQLNMGIPLTQMKLRVTDYSRVSTLSIEQHSSLKHQQEHFDEMIKSNSNWIYVDGYVDDGISGTTDFKREKFMQMIDDARLGKFDLIVTKEISRFSRNTLDSIKYTRELLSYGVAVFFVNDNINTAMPDSELRLTIMASMAQDEIRRLSERVKFGMNRSIKNGNILGNDLLYGYKKDKQTGNLFIVEEEARVVRRLYNLYAIDKLSISKIVKLFNNEGIKTSQDKKWKVSSLSRMIKNPKYKGYYCGKKSEIVDYMTKKVKILPENNWVIYEDKLKIPPIVDEILWECANERLRDRSKRFGKAYEDKLMYQNRYPLSAKMYCCEHNAVFHRRKQCIATNDITWACAIYFQKGKMACNSPNIRQSEIYAIFDDILKEFEVKLSNIIEILLELYKSNYKNVDNNNRLDELKKIREKIFRKKDKLLELNIEGNLSNGEFNERNDIYNRELEKISDEMTLLINNQNEFDVFNKNHELEKIIAKKMQGIMIKEKIIELLLEKIDVIKIDDDKTNVELKIIFKCSKDYVKDKNIISVQIVEGMKKIFQKAYEFKRGYNTTGTKRYIMKYLVKVYIKV